MGISKITIENFRSIKRLEFEPSHLCALIGSNSAGKTNVLLAIQRVLGKEWANARDFSEDDVYGRDPSLDISISITFDTPIPYAKFKESVPVEISTLVFEYKRYQRGVEKGQRRLDQSCLDAEGKPIFIPQKAPKKDEQMKFAPLTGVPPEVRAAIPTIFIDTNRNLEDHLPAARFSLLRQLFEDININFHDPAETVEVSDQSGGVITVSRSDRFTHLMDEAQKVLRTPEFEALEKSIKQNALEQLGYNPSLDQNHLDLFFSPLSTMDFYKLLDLRVKENNFTISATNLGGGIQNAIVIAILRAYEERKKKGAILLIEEPEMFLHPQMQRSLYKTIRKIGETNQVIYTTHSPHFVTIPDFEEIRIVKKDAEGTHIVKSGLTINALRREKIRKELDPERNEMFFAKKILLVEGDTEKLTIPEYAKRLGLDLDRAGATIVEVGGKKSLMEMALIAMSLEIPTGVLYDRDSSDFSRNPAGEEDAYNSQLNRLDDGVKTRVWMMKKDYEDELRTAFGETQYQTLCAKYGAISKVIRGRLIAEQETLLPIPTVIKEATEWLGDTK